MKKQLLLITLAALTSFSSKASAGLMVKIGLAGATATAGFIMTHEGVDNFVKGAHHLLSEALSTVTTKEVVAPLIRNASEKSQFLRKVVTGLAICATASFILDKALQKYDAYTLNKALEKYRAKHGTTNIIVDDTPLKKILEKKTK